MAEPIIVQVRGLEGAQRRLSSQQFDARAVSAMNESLAYLQGQVQANTPVDVGAARASVFTQVRGTSVLAGLRGIVGHAPNISYFPVLEEGRTPGARPPPVAAILPWVLRHGMPARAAYAVAIAIGRRGIPGKHMFANAARTAGPVIQAIWARRFAL